MPNPTKVFIVGASVAFIIDIMLLVLAQTGRIEPGWPAALGAVFVVLVWVGILVVGRLDRRRELDDIVRRVCDEEEQRETD
jgi:hypothetical protein